MTNWISSDTHLFHKNIIEYCDRPFPDLERMHENFRATWLNCVDKDDNVYLLGDISFGSRANTQKVFADLPGKITVIKGNHDNFKMLSSFETVLDYHETIIEMTRVCMFHFPMQSWHRKERGSVHVHGHMHGRGQDLPRRKDIGVDATKKWLTNLDELVLEMVKQPFIAER